jgi:hypothetical protein
MAQNSKRGWAIWGFNPETSAAYSNLRAKKQFTNKFNINLLCFVVVFIIAQSSSLVTENHQRTDVYFPAHAW